MFGGPETDTEALKGYDAEVATKHLQNVTQRKDMKIIKIIRCGEWRYAKFIYFRLYMSIVTNNTVRPNIRLAEKFHAGRVFIVGGKLSQQPFTLDPLMRGQRCCTCSSSGGRPRLEY